MSRKLTEHIGLLIAGILATVSLGLVISALWPWWSVQLARPHNSSVQSWPVVVLLAHQDDEMFLAGNLRRYVESGRKVYAVIVTDGAGSSVRKMLNGEAPDSRSSYRQYHQPWSEGYKPLNLQEFSAARNREVAASLEVIGILPEQIMFMNDGGVNGTSTPRYRDHQLTVEQVTQVIARVYDQLGNGTYLTLASGPGEAHFRNPDHWNLQKALQKFKGINEKFYFSDIATEYSQIISLTAGEQTAKQLALQNYTVWNPTEGRFAIGEHSVKYLLQSIQTSTEEYRLK